jgi:hypothetical protein
MMRLGNAVFSNHPISRGFGIAPLFFQRRKFMKSKRLPPLWKWLVEDAHHVSFLSKGAKTVLVAHPAGGIHRIHAPDGLTKDLHRQLVEEGYLHSHPQILAKIFASATAHAGRKIHVVHEDGFFVDGEHVNRDGSNPVPHDAKFGGAIDDKGSDGSFERNGKLVKNPTAAEGALAAE